MKKLFQKLNKPLYKKNLTESSETKNIEAKPNLKKPLFTSTNRNKITNDSTPIFNIFENAIDKKNDFTGWLKKRLAPRKKQQKEPARASIEDRKKDAVIEIIEIYNYLLTENMSYSEVMSQHRNEKNIFHKLL